MARHVGWWGRLFGERQDQALPLYNAVVTRGREPHWYLSGQVPDTVDGRFDMIAAVLTMVLLRLETDPAAATLSAHLTERFVDDMDKMMSMLGGRLGAYRDGLAAGDLTPALVRNLYRGEAPAPEAVAHVADALTAFRTALDATPLAHLTAGDLP